MQESELIERWQRVKDDIQEAKDRASRSDDVSLLAVSKTKPADMIVSLVKAGQYDFGENYLQEAIEKIDTVAKDLNSADSSNIRWHYIGHIQRNKTRDIAENFDWVHTIEREIIAKRLNNQRPQERGKLNVLIQVNIDNEESKSGCLPADVDSLVSQIKQYEKLNLRGLMIIPSKEDTHAFERTKELFDSVLQQHPELEQWDSLSMGMSADLQPAIIEGSTMVRVGSAIFGERE